MTLVFTDQQNAAIDAVENWYRTDPTEPFYLAGYAGAGKTSLAQEIVRRLGVSSTFLAFTGKAASVLEKKGCYGARTIHSAIYIPISKSEKRLRDLQKAASEYRSMDAPVPGHLLDQIEEEKANQKRPGFVLNLETDLREVSLVIVDEVSMLSKEIGDDLASFDEVDCGRSIGRFGFAGVGQLAQALSDGHASGFKHICCTRRCNDGEPKVDELLRGLGANGLVTIGEREEDRPRLR